MQALRDLYMFFPVHWTHSRVTSRRFSSVYRNKLHTHILILILKSKVAHVQGSVQQAHVMARSSLYKLSLLCLVERLDSVKGTTKSNTRKRGTQVCKKNLWPWNSSAPRRVTSSLSPYLSLHNSKHQFGVGAHSTPPYEIPYFGTPDRTLRCIRLWKKTKRDHSCSASEDVWEPCSLDCNLN